jgi:hypothetical protein
MTAGPPDLEAPTNIECGTQKCAYGQVCISSLVDGGYEFFCCDATDVIAFDGGEPIGCR